MPEEGLDRISRRKILTKRTTPGWNRLSTRRLLSPGDSYFFGDDAYFFPGHSYFFGDDNYLLPGDSYFFGDDTYFFPGHSYFFEDDNYFPWIIITFYGP
jgi:hypothetical protein